MPKKKALSTMQLRRNRIIEIIQSEPSILFAELIQRVNEDGFQASSTTINRDLSYLNMRKRHNQEGVRCYKATNDVMSSKRVEQLMKIYIKSVRRAGNMVLLKVHNETGYAVRGVLDELIDPRIVGVIADNNSVLVIAPDEATANELLTEIKLGDSR